MTALPVAGPATQQPTPAGRPADERHPFGYGQERYFWSLLAAFGIFIAGAGFSVFEGVLTLNRTGWSPRRTCSSIRRRRPPQPVLSS